LCGEKLGYHFVLSSYPKNGNGKMLKSSYLILYSLAKNGILFAALFAAVLLVNMPVISYDMMYLEQPMIYLANQTIHSLSDLLNVYLHPKLLDVAVPFFRPSGHFLIYQLLMPFLGWHNTRGMLIVNLLFLALIGYVMIMLYELLFPRFKVGGYIAFGIYAMQPALMLSRLTIMHFEFAYVFFVLLSLYCFVLFFKKNYFLETYPYYSCSLNKIKLNHLPLMIASLFFFIIAATFKEPAIMLGPVLVSYLVIALYGKQPIVKWAGELVRNKELVQIVLLVTATTLFLAFYLTMPWGSFANPDRNTTHLAEVWAGMKAFMKIIFSLNQQIAGEQGLYSPGMVLRYVVVSVAAHGLMWVSFFSFAASLFLLSREGKNRKMVPVQKSLFFLFIASVLFLILPIGWATGLPWHLSLSLACLSLMLGFGVDYFVCYFVKNSSAMMLFTAVSLTLIGVVAFTVNQDNIRYLAKTSEGHIYLLNRNAVLSPPMIQNQLNAASVLLVEDSQGFGDYALGDGGYPFFTAAGFDYDNFNKKQQYHYVKYQPRYNGTLFRWAYLMPMLQEEYFPFQVSDMKSVSDEAIYDWLAHYDNIFCVGYDASGAWFDRTATFKKNLWTEKKRRHLVINHYRVLSDSAMLGKSLYSKVLSLPESLSCQQICDQDKRCKGFTYVHAELAARSESKCHFYRSLAFASTQPCSVCTGFVKKAT
jgi:hypothetical protein